MVPSHHLTSPTSEPVYVGRQGLDEGFRHPRARALLCTAAPAHTPHFFHLE